jgi:hypothetical protein
MNLVPLHSSGTFRATDGELPHGCTNVWGMAILLRHRVGHFYVREAIGYAALCGVKVPGHTIWNGQNSLLGPGSYPKCKRCMEALRRKSWRYA